MKQFTCDRCSDVADGRLYMALRPSGAMGFGKINSTGKDLCQSCFDEMFEAMKSMPKIKKVGGISG